MRLIFVHGTGVRRERYEQLSALVFSGLSGRIPDAEVVSCYWGDDFGATLAAGGASIPGFDGTRGAAVGDPLNQATAEWQLLLMDPLCELRVLAELAAADDDGLGMPGVRPLGEEIADRLARLLGDQPGRDELSLLLEATCLLAHYPGAIQEVADSVEFADACAKASDGPTVRELAAISARAVVAQALYAAADEALCTGDERDRLVDLLSARLGGTGRFPGSRVGVILGTLALRLTTQPALDFWRAPLTKRSVPALGDILRYQTRGGPLRDRLEGLIAASAEPTVVIGHSLGGIALVDLLALTAIRPSPFPMPRLLVTVGSQAPFLHELGALTGLPPTAALPPEFPRWLNIFDRKDLLAYRAEPVFPDPRVTDHEVSSRQPFPLSHGAYWKLDAMYERIAEEIEASK
ncbi:hypothetical protein [Streptacidiphilus fuscans]|uniref:Uncharacterized protein n=1 Tax=Streptacidiphilus fuscans TaxID=2789292 RepID=A0A931FEL6_9ACTN|nr:hypothetical protein [Streptacidiphilus fuscans]MBF9071912.1 hypothetical protein [Streptacidiphilus fuscans]